MKNRIKLIVVAVFVITLVGLLAACGDAGTSLVDASADSTGRYYAAGEVTAPGFTGVDVVTNQAITLDQFQGMVILFNFVNYGCDTTLNSVVSEQLLAIKELQSRRSDFVPVSVFCGCCSPEVLREFAEQNGLAWSWILDTDYTIIDAYSDYLRDYGYPTLILIDGDQYIRQVNGYSGTDSLSDALDLISGESN